MIKSLKVEKLNGHMDFDLKFHEDLNILTGRNGSGKTSVLKLLWAVMSGNIQLLSEDIVFTRIVLETDDFILDCTKSSNTPPKFFRVRTPAGFEAFNVRVKGKGKSITNIQPFNDFARSNGSHSIYFPTFRRIEGGFTFPGGLTQLSQVLETYKRNLNLGSSKYHEFVLAISTQDVVARYTDKFAEISEITNKLNGDLSQYILSQTNKHDSDALALEKIKFEVESVSRQNKELLKPVTVLMDLAKKILGYSGIKLSSHVLGESNQAILSDVLSAGEKQMLSFLCYNAFAKNATIFIDEPEISLHVDWQRMLFPELLKQSTGNQFIVATHSPFIYSKYPDKEIILAPDRGNTDAESDPDANGDYQHIAEDEFANAPG